MQVTILGGVNEYGRACFHLMSSTTSILLDCGIMKDETLPEEKKNPLLTKTLVSTLQAIFITHSHEDHWGGIFDLIKKGFSGRVYCTVETRKQIKNMNASVINNENITWIDLESISVNKKFEFNNTTTIAWGPNGHLLGSVWFHVQMAGKNIFYTGDYSSDSLLLKCSWPNHNTIDLGIMDNAYGLDRSSKEMQLKSIDEKVDKVIGQKGRVLFPVPVFGRGQELLAYAAVKYGKHKLPIYVEDAIYDELCKYITMPIHLTENGRHLTKSAVESENIHVFNPKSIPDIGYLQEQPCIVFSAGGMLESNSSREIFRQLKETDLVILTGNQACGSFGRELLNNKIKHRAEVTFIRYNVHQNIIHLKEFISKVKLKRILLYHGEQINMESIYPQLKIQESPRFLYLKPGDSVCL